MDALTHFMAGDLSPGLKRGALRLW